MISIATWNINSVRLRIDQVSRFLTEQAPDVLCLQEIKTEEKHLLGEDAKYREYHAWMEQGPTITRWLGRLGSAVRPRRMPLP